jgi:hypothetical protein
VANTVDTSTFALAVVSTHYTDSKANKELGRAGKARVTSKGTPSLYVTVKNSAGQAFTGNLVASDSAE